ncbi:MAG: hypothetical protein E7185_09750 [Erysipelotrichaceae bacterium]|nr:hypothetical protein [Erysipelotrichaceae bacterium]
MAQNVIINGVTYQNVPEVDIPKSGGGTAKFYDTAGATADASMILATKIAFGANGSITGSMANNGATGGSIGTKADTVAIPAGYTTGGTVSLADVDDCLPQNILVNKRILGVVGTLVLPTISQDSTTKILSIS